MLGYRLYVTEKGHYKTPNTSNILHTIRNC